MKVRALEAGDRDAWGYLWKRYLDYYETELPPEMYDIAFNRMLSGSEHEFHGLVAEKDGELIGLTHYLLHRHGWKVEPVIYLQDLYVSDAARGTGAGRALIEAVYAAGDAAGSPTVYWLTQDFNENGRRLYDRVGSLTPFIKYQR
ncbi:MAG TPA: GNAT family N-acetyltransferase [Rhodobacteraceae bacterium]|nr:GNAT family N-acetyltransferase [Paracoccaceae bacterium]